MSASQLSVVTVSNQSQEKKVKATKDKVKNTLSSEIVLGICTSIGSLKDEVVDLIISLLEKKYKYETKKIKLSKFIEEYYDSQSDLELGLSTGFTHLMNKIKGGDHLRSKYTLSCLAELAIRDIHHQRLRDNNINVSDGTYDITKLNTKRRCYIIDSLKNREELDLLRAVYGDIFYCFSIFSPEEERRENLLKKDLTKSEIERIINTDEYENNSHGQNVRDTFVEGDFFIRVSKNNIQELDGKIERYFNIIFESDVVTPTSNEIAMYEAKSAAGNSACLSRQVGAAITNSKGEIISRGWNDVPRFGGNLYKEGEEKDFRCKSASLGYCSNDKTKKTVADDILKGFINNEDIKLKLFGDEEVNENHPIFEQMITIIRKNTKVKDLIEFSRSVHAEMHAIIVGSQLAGSKMIGGKLFCTTYPCHNCARHIIVAGIEEIYYIEPYKKSLCIELHKDAITENETSNEHVKILMYDGVAPRRYLEFFTLSKQRKDKDGLLIKDKFDKINPKTRITLQALPTLETQAIHSLNETGLLKISQ